MDNNEKLTYDEVVNKAFNKSWKIETCAMGEDCWCRMITTEEPLIFDNDEVYFIAGSGKLSKEVAEYIVILHNERLNL